MVTWCSVALAQSSLPECEGTDYSKWTNCHGTMTFTNGNKYVGEWKDGDLHGQGTYTWASSESKYVGGFKDGKRHGQGTYTYANGDKYVGEFKNNKRHGQGTNTFANGDKYVGEFKNNKQHGQVTHTYADGTVVVSIFKKGKLVKILSSDTSAKDKMKLVSMVDDAKKTCKELGFTEGTEKFSDCSLKLYSQSVELAAKQNQQVVIQTQGNTSSSGSNVMTI